MHAGSTALTADGGHILGGINGKHLAQLAEGKGTVVLPFEVARWVRGGGFAAIPGKAELHLWHVGAGRAVTKQWNSYEMRIAA